MHTYTYKSYVYTNTHTDIYALGWYKEFIFKKNMCWHSREVIIFSYIGSNDFLLLINMEREFLLLQPIGTNCTVYEIAALLNQWDMIITVKCGFLCLCIKRQGHTYTALKFLTVRNMVSVFLDCTACLSAKYSTC